MRLTRTIVTLASVKYLLDRSMVKKCSDEEYNLALREHLKHNLRYNVKTGVTRDDNIGMLARYSDFADVPRYITEEEVLQWELLPRINSSISRVQRGYDA